MPFVVYTNVVQYSSDTNMYVVVVAEIIRSVLLVAISSVFLLHQISTSELAVYFSLTTNQQQPQPAEQSDSCADLFFQKK